MTRATMSDAEIARALEALSVERPKELRGPDGRSRRYRVKDQGNLVTIVYTIDRRKWTADGYAPRQITALLRRMLRRHGSRQSLAEQIAPRRDLMAASVAKHLSTQNLEQYQKLATDRMEVTAEDIREQVPEDVATVMVADGRRMRRLVREVWRLRAELGELKTKRSRG